MPEWAFAAIGLALLGLFLWYQRNLQRRQIAVSRIPRVREEEHVRVLHVPGAETAFEQWLPWVVGAGAAIAFTLFTDLGTFFALSIGLLFFILGYLVKWSLVNRRTLKLEMQLAEAIDHIVTSLHAGIGVLDALAGAEQACRRPLKAHLTTLLSRIRLGDDPVEVSKDMAQLLPLESFRLFYYALAVQWEGGGNLAPTLATTGRFIRDRVEVGRRVRGQAIEARFSVVAVLLLTYFLGLLMWHMDASRMEGFLATDLGRALVAGSIVLQALGAAWVARMSRIRF